MQTTALRLEDENLFLLDQTLLPLKEKWTEIKTPDQMKRLRLLYLMLIFYAVILFDRPLKSTCFINYND